MGTKDVMETNLILKWFMTFIWYKMRAGTENKEVKLDVITKAYFYGKVASSYEEPFSDGVRDVDLPFDESLFHAQYLFAVGNVLSTGAK